MSDLIWLSEAQMRRIEPYFPLSHGERGEFSAVAHPGHFISFTFRPGCLTWKSINRRVVHSSGWWCEAQLCRLW